VSSPPILGYAIDNIRGKIADLRALGFEPHRLISRWPIVLGYSLKRIRFCADVTTTIAKGNEGLFCELLTKEPAATAVAASDQESLDLVTFRKQLRLRRGKTDENLALLDLRYSDPMAVAYRDYRGTQLEHPVFQESAAA
jgi:hypothetical protein